MHRSSSETKEHAFPLLRFKKHYSPVPVLFNPPPSPLPRPTYRRPRGNSFRCAFACVTTPLRAYSRLGYIRATYRCTFAHAIDNCPATRRHPVRMHPASATTPLFSSYSVFAASSERMHLNRLQRANRCYRRRRVPSPTIEAE